MTPAEVVSLVCDHLDWPGDDIVVEPVAGGLINEVFRARARARARAPNRSVIVKRASPFAAAIPELALSTRRVAIEATCLRELGPGGRLADVPSAAIRVPRLLAYDGARGCLIMEDCGPIPDLGSAEVVAPALGGELGAFLARLHASSRSQPALLAELDNRSIQEVRYASQYSQVSHWLADAGHSTWRIVDGIARELGQRFLEPGRSAIMGDLWLRSLLVDSDGLWVIDWEFAHAGNPGQDLGHLLAHLWMHADRAPRSRSLELIAFRDRFAMSYRQALEDLGAGDVLSHEVLRDADRHAGCEILARALGPFRAQSCYRDHATNDAVVTRAIGAACDALVGDHSFWPRASTTPGPGRVDLA